MSAHLARAWQLYELRRDKLAVEEAQRHLAKWPEDADAYRLIAHAAARLGDADTAMQAAMQAVELAPDWEDAYAALSAAAQQSEQWEVAESAIQEALRLDPEEARFYANYARLLIHRAQYDKALKIVLQGLEHDPEHEFLVFARPLVLWSLDEYDEARYWLQEALSLYPDDSNLHALQGAILIGQDRSKEAITPLLESLRLDPENEWALAKLDEAKLCTAFWCRVMDWYTYGPVFALFLLLIVFAGLGADGLKGKRDRATTIPLKNQIPPIRVKEEDIRKMPPEARRILSPDWGKRMKNKQKAKREATSVLNTQDDEQGAHD
jgi:tetratricopeptide (TPR) repeat protein